MRLDGENEGVRASPVLGEADLANAEACQAGLAGAVDRDRRAVAGDKPAEAVGGIAPSLLVWIARAFLGGIRIAPDLHLNVDRLILRREQELGRAVPLGHLVQRAVRTDANQERPGQVLPVGSLPDASPTVAALLHRTGAGPRVVRAARGIGESARVGIATAAGLAARGGGAECHDLPAELAEQDVVWRLVLGVVFEASPLEVLDIV